MRHAVFATTQDLVRCRVTGYGEWGAAITEWDRIDGLIKTGKLAGTEYVPGVRFVEVRSEDDPGYNGTPYEPWVAVPVEERPQWVKLSRSERRDLLAVGRAQYDIESAGDAMMSKVMEDGRWAHLSAVTISDYTWAAARFCFPQEAKQW